MVHWARFCVIFENSVPNPSGQLANLSARSSAMGGAGSRIVESKLCSPRGVTSAYVGLRPSRRCRIAWRHQEGNPGAVQGDLAHVVA
eukprot:1149228-Prymnesium_polylepis.2